MELTTILHKWYKLNCIWSFLILRQFQVLELKLGRLGRFNLKKETGKNFQGHRNIL